MIASVLPLPPQPEMVQDATPSQMDLEQHLARELGPVDDRSHQKANWWRNLNRIMSGIGTLLIGVIVSSRINLSATFTDWYQIALAILASRMT